MSLSGLLLAIIGFIVVIGPLVFVHELGHYLVARWCGVKAEVFSIGFGRELIGWHDSQGTRWRISALPLGGYVKFLGEMDGSGADGAEWIAMPPSERARSFSSKPVWQRFAIVLAGPLINLLLAVLLLGALAYWKGEPEVPAVVGAVAAGSPAEKAGIAKGDRIISIAGRSVSGFSDISSSVSLHPGEPLDFVVRRGESTQTKSIVPAVRIEKDRFGNIYRIGQIGIASGRVTYRSISLIEVPAIGTRHAWQITRSALDGLGQIITGRRPVSELGGPLRIADISGQAAASGLANIIFLMALISINLGFINLLPIPMLDGGHLLFYIIEAIARKPVSQDVQMWAFRSGLAFLLVLMVMVTFNDLASFGLMKSLSGLIG